MKTTSLAQQLAADFPGLAIKPVVDDLFARRNGQCKHGSSSILANHFYDLSFMPDGMPIHRRDFQ